MKTTIFLSIIIIFLFISQSIKAQDKETLDSLLSPRRLLFEKPHTKFQFNLITSKGRIEREYGEAELQSRLGWSYFLMWSQTHHLNPNWGLEYGFSIGTLPLRYYIDLKAQGFEALDYDYLLYSTNTINFIQLPLNIVYRKPVSSNVFLQFRTGISLRYILLEEYITTAISLSTPPLVLTYYESYSEFDNNFRINFNLGAGISWLLPNNDFLDFQIIANLSPRNIVYNDYYFFPDTPDETFGHYLSNGNYVGVSVGYTFTKVRKILRQYRKGIR